MWAPHQGADKLHALQINDFTECLSSHSSTEVNEPFGEVISTNQHEAEVVFVLEC